MDAGIFALSQVAFYYAFKVWRRSRPLHVLSRDLTLSLSPAIDRETQAIMGQMDPQKGKRKEAKSKSKEALGKLGLDLSTLDLNEHEEQIASEVVAAEDINVTFKGQSRSYTCSATGRQELTTVIEQTLVDSTRSFRN